MVLTKFTFCPLINNCGLCVGTARVTFRALSDGVRWHLKPRFHFRYLCSAMMQRALLAPLVWVLVTLLDGKCFICAFSMSVNPRHFTGIPNNTGMDLVRLMAKVPCKEDAVFRNSTFRKAVTRYVRCYSQVSVCLCFHSGRSQKTCSLGVRGALKLYCSDCSTYFVERQ